MKILPLVILCVLSACPALQAREGSASEAVSPVYERMVGNKAVLLYKELIRNNKVKHGEPFYLIDWEGGQLASRVLARLGGEKEIFRDWEERSCPPCDVKRGIIFLEAGRFNPRHGNTERTLHDAARFLKRMDAGFLIVFYEEEGESLKQFFANEGLKTIEDIRESELEFLKDSSGRQAVDLSDPKVVGPVYERLVYEGLNPVQAWPLAEEAIRHFRSSNGRILIAGRPGVHTT